MRGARGYLWTIVFVGLVTAVGLPLRGHLADADVVMLYMVAICTAAARFGRGPAVLASAASVLAFNFFFVPPYHTFRSTDEHFLLTFAMMFAAGLLTSALLHRVRQGQREELRSALLSTVSHDLRTPLAAITGAGTTLKEGWEALTPPQRSEMLDTICQEAERLERLVSNLLDMTRLEAGALSVKREWVPLEEMVGSALARLESRLAGRTITTDLPESLPLVSVDAVLFEQLFVNLLDNAAKHTPRDTPIEVRARSSADGVEIEVADRGPGLPAGGETRLFDKFFRGPHTSVEGAGLGLAICRGIAHTHGGTVTAENRPGGGSLFRVQLPLSGPPPSVPITREAEAEAGVS
jgi:two-component system, OmpR family, sensor histidine kinase KdpD